MIVGLYNRIILAIIIIMFIYSGIDTNETVGRQIKIRGPQMATLSLNKHYCYNVDIIYQY